MNFETIKFSCPVVEKQQEKMILYEEMNETNEILKNSDLTITQTVDTVYSTSCGSSNTLCHNKRAQSSKKWC